MGGQGNIHLWIWYPSVCFNIWNVETLQALGKSNWMVEDNKEMMMTSLITKIFIGIMIIDEFIVLGLFALGVL